MLELASEGASVLELASEGASVLELASEGASVLELASELEPLERNPHRTPLPREDTNKQ